MGSMKATAPVTIALFLTTACSTAWSQTKLIAGGPSDAELKRALTPQLSLSSWRLPRDIPRLACPAGSAQTSKRQRGEPAPASWQTHCVKGNKRHGPYQRFDRSTRTHVSGEYRDGVEHGWQIKVRTQPSIALEQKYVNRSAWTVGDLEKLPDQFRTLSDWWPSSKAPRLACPTGTTQQQKQYSPYLIDVFCQFPDETQHGPHVRLNLRSGVERYSQYALGEATRTVLVLDDQRSSEELLYKKGKPVRRLVWSRRGLQTFEAMRGAERVFVRWDKEGRAASLVRFRNDRRHGESLWWHANGQLARRVAYREGLEQPGGKKWNDKGVLIETRQMNRGTGQIIRVQPGRGNEKTVCEYVADQKTSCRTNTGKGQLVDDQVYQDGHLIHRKTFWDAGPLRTEYVQDLATGRSEQKNYGHQGQVEQVSRCVHSQCETVRYDRQGKATIVHSSGPPRDVKVLERIADML